TGRWVQITGLRYKPELDQIRGWMIRPDYRRSLELNFQRLREYSTAGLSFVSTYSSSCLFSLYITS
ncbi:hypothetical protein PZH42_30100, partial [Bacteroides cellulosilyticus]